MKIENKRPIVRQYIHSGPGSGNRLFSGYRFFSGNQSSNIIHFTDFPRAGSTSTRDSVFTDSSDVRGNSIKSVSPFINSRILRTNLDILEIH